MQTINLLEGTGDCIRLGTTEKKTEASVSRAAHAIIKWCVPLIQRCISALKSLTRPVRASVEIP